MVYSPTMPSMKLTAQDMGVPDYQKALENVFSNVYKPRQMSEDLLKTQLENKYAAFKNTPEYQAAMLDFLRGQGANMFAQANRANSELNPYDKIAAQMQAAADKENLIAQQKESRSLEQELPEFEKNIENVNRLEEIATKHPEFFGLGPLGINNPRIAGPKYRARTELANLPEYGEFTTRLSPFIAETAKGFSSRPLALSLNTAIQSKPSFEEQQKQALGKIRAMKQQLESGKAQAKKRYFELTGKELPSSVYNAEKDIQKEMAGVPTGKIRLYLNGKPHLIPVKLANKFLKQKGASANG